MPAEVSGPVLAAPGPSAVAAIRTSLVVHQWSGSGPACMHTHRSDDEAAVCWRRRALPDRFTEAESMPPAFMPINRPPLPESEPLIHQTTIAGSPT
jgi:hypothetical protein